MFNNCWGGWMLLIFESILFCNTYLLRVTWLSFTHMRCKVTALYGDRHWNPALCSKEGVGVHSLWKSLPGPREPCNRQSRPLKIELLLSWPSCGKEGGSHPQFLQVLSALWTKSLSRVITLIAKEHKCQMFKIQKYPLEFTICTVFGRELLCFVFSCSNTMWLSRAASDSWLCVHDLGLIALGLILQVDH